MHALVKTIAFRGIDITLADVVKEGTHFDLPIALGLLIAMGVVSPDAIADRVVLGELALDGSIHQVSGVLPAALAAAASGQHIICQAVCGPEAAWASGLDIIAAPDLVSLLNHLKGVQILSPPEPKYLSVDAAILVTQRVHAAVRQPVAAAMWPAYQAR